jgi:HYR domain
LPTATDAVDGLCPVTCAPASGTTFPVTTKTVTCTASDLSRNNAAVTFTVAVVYQAPGDGTFFKQPINPDGSSIFKAGSTIPVKFQLTGASASITNLVARLLVAKVSSGIVGTDSELSSNAAPDGGNQFRYDASANQYVFNLSTKSMSTGTWTIRADLGDGVDHSVKVSLK